MAIEHILFMEFSDSTTEAQAQGCLDAIANLQEKIPGILDVKTGKNFSNRAGNTSHGAVVTLEDKQSLEVYATHAAHQDVLKLLKRHLKNILVVDFES